ncbi:MAG: pyridoxamine 5'-phosphate oxidase family protein [Thaumarchaeota archaeon]|nr:pyridoxamine 5'-phosphate oxidase family protein [Nitrososphaerota archaeon]
MTRCPAIDRRNLTAEEERFVEGEPVLRLATSSPIATPHVVPLCFAYWGQAFYTHLKNGDAYQRVRNIRRTGKAAVLVDRYNPLWKLGQKRGGNVGVLVQGRSEVLEEGEENEEARRLLVAKYPQYAGSEVERGCPVLKVSIVKVVSWGFG